MKSREQQKEERRNQILEAGLNLFIKRGYSGTKISDIATACGMSVGLLFHYFASKQALFEQLIKVGMYGTQWAAEMEEAPLIYFEKVVKELFDYMDENPFIGKFFVLMNNAMHDESIPEEAKELLQQADAQERSLDYIRQGQLEGSIRPGDPVALQIAFWNSVQGIVEDRAWHPEHPKVEPEWVLDMIRSKD